MAKTKSDSELPSTSREMIFESAEKLQYLPLELPGGMELDEKQNNLEEEKKWLEEMTERAERANADPEVQFAVGQYYFLHQKYARALDYFERTASASRGNKTSSTGYQMQATYQLGVLYFDGLGVDYDAEKGSAFMLQVAQCNDQNSDHIVLCAQYNMGRAHFMGFGVRQSDKKAEEWWLAAADKGKDPISIRAKHTLGLFYSRSDSFDVNKSFKWHKEAAEDGHLESMAAVGLLYDLGEGCKQNKEEALTWLRRSCQGGSIYGTGLLARHYYEAKMFLRATETAYRVSEVDRSGPPNEEGESSMALSQLDRTGIAVSCFVLARCLELGLGLDMSIDKAKHYYSKATHYDENMVAKLHSLRVLGRF